MSWTKVVKGKARACCCTIDPLGFTCGKSAEKSWCHDRASTDPSLMVESVFQAIVFFKFIHQKGGEQLFKSHGGAPPESS
jgi:hypothetical protein